MNEPIVDPLLAAEPEATFDLNAQLIPRDSVAGRALVVVIAIMTFLACLTAGAALLVADASRSWRSEVLRDATIQVKAGPGPKTSQHCAERWRRCHKPISTTTASGRRASGQWRTPSLSLPPPSSPS